MNKWYSLWNYDTEHASARRAVDSGIVIGTQICLFRNLEGYVFADKLDRDSQKEVLEKVAYALRESESALRKKFRFINLSGRPRLQKCYVAELAIPGHVITAGSEVGLFKTDDERVCIYVNGKEHLCIQISAKGMKISECVKTAYEIEEALGTFLTYSFNEKYGYLTADPALTGTAISASVLLHLPLLESTNQLQTFEKGLGQYGFSLRSLFKGDEGGVGHIYRLRNRRTLGISEKETLSALDTLTRKIAEMEYTQTEKRYREDPVGMSDLAMRAYGVLKYAGKLRYEETMMMLSLVRKGLLNDVLRDEKQKDVFGLMINVQNSRLLKQKNAVSAQEIEIMRAEKVRDRMNDMMMPGAYPEHLEQE